MTEERLKEIKASLDEDLQNSVDYFGSETAKEGLELYNEVIRLRKIFHKIKKYLKENEKKYGLLEDNEKIILSYIKGE